MNDRMRKKMNTLLKDNITLKKKDGKETNNINANVQGERIIIHRSDILIETGDFLIRKMSNGGEETYKVIDPCFHEKGVLDAHYQSIVKKVGTPVLEYENQPSNINIYQYGDNSRVNQNSIDNSNNYLNGSNVDNHINDKEMKLIKFIKILKNYQTI